MISPKFGRQGSGGRSSLGGLTSPPSSKTSPPASKIPEDDDVEDSKEMGDLPRFHQSPLDILGSEDQMLLIPVPDLDELTAEETADFFLRTEMHYVQEILRPVFEPYFQRLKAHIKLDIEIVPESDMLPMFANFDTIFEFHQKLVNEMLDLRLQGLLIEQLGKLMRKMSPFFRLYSNYANVFQSSISYIELVLNKNLKFKELCEVNQNISKQSLINLLKVPVARLPQYLIFLGAIHKKLVFYSQAAIDLEDGIVAVKSVTDEIAKRLREETKKKNVLIIQELFMNQVELVTPSRYLVKSGDLIKIFNNKFAKLSKEKKYFFVLFNDLFIYGIRSKGRGKKVKVMMSMEGLSAREVADGTIKNTSNAFRINSKEKSFVVVAKSPEDRNDWIDCITHCVDAWTAAEKERVEMIKSAAGSPMPTRRRGASIMDEQASWIPDPPPCPLSVQIPDAPCIPLSFRIPEAPPVPESCLVPNAPGCPLGVDIPDVPFCPESCFLPEAPPAPPLVVRAVVSAAPPPPPPPAGGAAASSDGPAAPVMKFDAGMLAAAAKGLKGASEKAPEPAPTADSGSEGGMAGLFAQIKAGAVKLKKVESPDKKLLLKEELRKIESGQSSKKRDSLPGVDVGALDIQTALHVSLVRYRQFVQKDTGDKDDDDDDDDDDTGSDWE